MNAGGVIALIKALAGGGGGGGGGASVLVVNVTEEDDNYTCDKTAAEMWAAMPLVCTKTNSGGVDYIRGIYIAGKNGDAYMFDDGEHRYEAMSGADYPTAGGVM